MQSHSGKVLEVTKKYLNRKQAAVNVENQHIISIIALHLSFITASTQRTVSRQQVCLEQLRYQQDLDCSALFGVT